MLHLLHCFLKRAPLERPPLESKGAENTERSAIHSIHHIPPTFLNILVSLFVVSLAYSPRKEQNVVPSLQQAVHVPRGYRHSSELVNSGEQMSVGLG